MTPTQSAPLAIFDHSVADVSLPPLAIVGVGNIASHQIKAIRAVGADLHAVCDTDPAKLADKAVPSFTRLDRMLDSADEQLAVLVSIPLPAHVEVAEQVLAAGHHVLLEKPPVRWIEELDSLYARAEGNDVLLYCMFHAAQAKEVRWYIREYYPAHRDKLGELIAFRSKFFDPLIQFDPITQHDLLNPAAASLEGSWRDSGINAVSVISELVDYLGPSSFSFERSGPLEQKCSVMFHFGDEHIGRIDVDWTRGLNWKETTLHYSSGWTIHLQHSWQRVVREKGTVWEVVRDLSGGEDRLTNHYVGVLKDFGDHLVHGETNREFSLQCMRSYLAPYTGKLISAKRKV